MFRKSICLWLKPALGFVFPLFSLFPATAVPGQATGYAYFQEVACRPEALRCEYLAGPLGIDTPRPRLSWRLGDPRTGARQTAFRLWVGTDSLAVAQGRGDHWDTGVRSSDRLMIPYDGDPLQPFTRYFWTVQVWDKDGNAGSTAPVAAFEMGMMDRRQWRGIWITDTRDIHLKPAPFFRREFNLPRRIRSARVYLAAAGLYELYLNGQRIGDRLLDPAYTRFDRRNLYVTYDVSAQLKSGRNAIGVLLGNGWYNHQSTAVWYFDQAPWRARPRFCLDLRIAYEDGSVEVIHSGPDWKTALSPVIFNSIYTAEHYDARLEQEGWAAPGFDDSAWKDAEITGAPAQNITAQAMHPIRAVEAIPVQSLRRINDTTWLADFGRNISGICRLTVSGEAGTTFRLRHAERLDENGRANDAHIDVGLLGTKAVLNALSENKHADLAYRVAAQETFPSWGWWIVNGATTLYENWPIDAQRDISLNHIMFGEISAWMYKALGGIFPDEALPGFKHVILKPHFAEGLDAFEATHEGPCGTVVSKWQKTAGRIDYEVAIPPNSTATLYLPGSSIMVDGLPADRAAGVSITRQPEEGLILRLEAGTYRFSW